MAITAYVDDREAFSQVPLFTPHPILLRAATVIFADTNLPHLNHYLGLRALLPAPRLPILEYGPTSLLWPASPARRCGLLSRSLPHSHPRSHAGLSASHSHDVPLPWLSFMLALLRLQHLPPSFA